MSGQKKKYVILPDDNVFNEDMQTSSFGVFQEMHRQLHGQAAATATSMGIGPESASPVRVPKMRFMNTEAGRVQLLDSIDLNEATLVSMSDEQAEDFARKYPGLRIKPELALYPLRFGARNLLQKTANPALFRSAKTLTIQCVDSVTGAPVANAPLIIMLNQKKRVGIDGIVTDAAGRFTTVLPAGQKVIDTILCVPLAGYWGARLGAISVTGNSTTVPLSVVPIADGHRDGIDLMLAAAGAGDGRGVKVAIIDAGVSPAAGLNIVKGLNTTGTEPAANWQDNGSGHGTHVAGIVSRIAPAAEIYVYRVFEQSAPTASEFAIARAIREAVEEGCDLINLSLGQSTEPYAISREVRRARAFGAVCVAATGNDYMSPVSYPARNRSVVAVAACGSLGSWPQGAMNDSNVANAPAPVGNVFFASFSNVGPEVDFIAPGVGIISWVSAISRGVMDGTSMACPATTALIARMLAAQPALLNAFRDQQRSDNIIKAAFAQATPIGFGANYEGAGIV